MRMLILFGLIAGLSAPALEAGEPEKRHAKRDNHHAGKAHREARSPRENRSSREQPSSRENRNSYQRSSRESHVPRVVTTPRPNINNYPDRTQNRVQSRNQNYQVRPDNTPRFERIEKRPEREVSTYKPRERVVRVEDNIGHRNEVYTPPADRQKPGVVNQRPERAQHSNERRHQAEDRRSHRDNNFSDNKRSHERHRNLGRYPSHNRSLVIAEHDRYKRHDRRHTRYDHGHIRNYRGKHHRGYHRYGSYHRGHGHYHYDYQFRHWYNPVLWYDDYYYQAYFDWRWRHAGGWHFGIYYSDYYDPYYCPDAFAEFVAGLAIGALIFNW